MRLWRQLWEASNFPITRRSRVVQREPFFRMKEVPSEANTETHINVISNLGNLSRHEMLPRTDRKHQLRLHRAASGIPVLNDKLYPALTLSETHDFSRPLQLLAKSISFRSIERVGNTILKVAQDYEHTS